MSELKIEVGRLAKKFSVEVVDVGRVIKRGQNSTLQNMCGDDVLFRFYGDGIFAVSRDVQGERLKESFKFEGGGLVSLDAFAMGLDSYCPRKF